MKTIKPSNKNIIINPEPIKSNNDLVIGHAESYIVKDEPTGTIEDLMNSVLQENNYIQKEQENVNPNLVKVEFYLTKRQYGLWVKKGEVKWLKKKLVN